MYNIAKYYPELDMNTLEVYEYYDGPRLFSYKTLDKSLYYLFVWCDELVLYDTYLVGKIQQEIMCLLKNSEVDFNITFKSSVDNELDLYFVDTRGLGDYIYTYNVEDMDTEVFPDPGVYFRA